MKNKIEKLYQLKVEQWLEYGEWSGTVFYSKLYLSEKDCIEGCLTFELCDIASAVSDYSNTSVGLYGGDEICKSYLAKDEETVAFVDRVTKWLKGAENETFDEDEEMVRNLSVFWEIAEHEFPPGLTLTAA